MRLLHTNTRHFHEYNEHQNPTQRYAILSHRWIDDEEVSYQEFLLITAGDDLHENSIGPQRRSTLRQKTDGSGFQKIDKACQRALQDGYEFIWIDTCCIDKTSSAELSEAINSMWNWYYNSAICYAYLADVDNCEASGMLPNSQDFAHSQWFLRSWCLQELLAPKTVLFYDRDWILICEKVTASVRVSEITGIDRKVIADRRVINAHSINTKMTWAANRKATRIEDQAYSLLGLFRVNMSLLYGEGSNAFLRLQKEILAQSDDESIFVHSHKFDLHHSPMAMTPSDFVVEDEVLGRRELRCFEHTQLGSHPFTVTNKGIQWRAAFVREALKLGYFVIALNCRYKLQHIPVLLSLWRPSGLFGENDSNYIVLPSTHWPSWLPDNIQDAKVAMRMLESFVENKETYDPFEYHTITLSWLRTVLVRAPSGSETFDHYQMQNQVWNNPRNYARPLRGPFPALLRASYGTQANSETALSLVNLNVPRPDESFNEHSQFGSLALATFLDRILNNVLVSQPSSNTKLEDFMKSLGSLFGVDGQEEEDALETHLDLLFPGTCKWLLEKPEFKTWQFDDWSRIGSDLQLMSTAQPATGHGTARIFWLTGMAGSGKSMIAAQLVDHLREQNQNCQFYFFRYGDKVKQDVGVFLKSLAMQMAIQNDIVRQSLWTMLEDDAWGASHDYRAIWRQIFVQRILRTSFYQQQYWIIDGLDEAIDGRGLISLISKIPDNLPIKIFITSRRDLHLDKELPWRTITHTQIEPQDTFKDLRMFLEDEIPNLHGDDDLKQTLLNNILQKSQGNFLWTKLVLGKIVTAHTKDEIDEILSTVPQGMHNIYMRILQNMEQRFGKSQKLFKSILRWVICSGRPLSMAELNAAIEIDIQGELLDMRKMVATLCADLVVVDAHDNVQIIHDTLREFLLNPDLSSKYAVDAATTHAQLAAICMEHLATRGPERRLKIRPNAQDSIRSYANLYFSHHLERCHVLWSDSLFSTLVHFLQRSILSWIEYIASKVGDLSHLVRAGLVLKHSVRIYLQKCPARPMDQRIELTDKWGTDLVRLTTAFGSVLLAHPAAIHRIIPALCPSTSMLYKQFGGSIPHDEVAGSLFQDWPQRIYSVSYPDSEASAVTCSEAYCAVGLRDGLVLVYDSFTWLETCRLPHGEQVRFLRFLPESQRLLVCGTSSMSIWHYGTTETIWRLALSSEPVALHWSEENIIRVIYKSCETIQYDAATGQEIDNRSLEGEASIAPQKIVVCDQLNLAASIYHDGVLILHDLARLEDSVLHHRVVEVSTVAFNETSEMLAISTCNGEIYTVDVWSLHEESRICANTAATLLDVSPDGTMLLVGSDSGSIQVHQFKSLLCLCYVDISTGILTALTFSVDGLQILGIKEGQFNVWEPAELTRGNHVITSSGSNIAHPPDRVDALASVPESPIIAIAMHHGGHSALCARPDGTVAVYSSRSSALSQELFECKSTIKILEWHSEQGVITVADDLHRVILYRTDTVNDHGSKDLKQRWEVRPIFEETLSEPVGQALLTKDGNFAFVSTSTSDYLWKIDGDYGDTSRDKENRRKNYLPMSSQVAHVPRQIFKLNRTELWQTRRNGIEGSEQELVCVTVDRTRCFGSEAEPLGPYLKDTDETSTVFHCYWPATSTIWIGRPSFSTPKEDATMLITYKDLQPHVREILGKYYLRLVFIDTDDWICTMMPNVPGEKMEIQRHLPVPRMWRASGQKIVAALSDRGDLFIARGGELVSFRMKDLINQTDDYLRQQKRVKKRT